MMGRFWGTRKCFSYFFNALLIYRKNGGFWRIHTERGCALSTRKKRSKKSLQLIETPQISYLHL